MISSLTDSILVGHLQTAMEEAVVVEPGTPVRSAVRALKQHAFDQAPVLVDGEPVGYVLLRDLTAARGSVGSVVRPILPHALASEFAPLQDALEWLAKSGFLFLLRGQRVSGFIVPSDLNRQAGRTYFYLGLAALELQLAEWVREINRHRDVLDALHPSRAGNIRRQHLLAKEANIEADVVAELQLGDLFKVASEDQRLLAAVGMEAPADLLRTWKDVKAVRNRIAHPVRPVLESLDGLGALLAVDSAIHSMISALQAMGPTGMGAGT